MEYLDVNKLTNAELKQYCTDLEKNYENIKAEINSLLQELDKMDAEYIKATREINKRKNPIF